MDKNDLKIKTKDFALRVYNLINALPNTIAGRKVADQLFSSATSVAANYRAVCRGRSAAEFKSKLHIVLEESDESEFWLEFIIDAKLLDEKQIIPLLKKANELTSIFAKSYYQQKTKNKSLKSLIDDSIILHGQLDGKIGGAFSSAANIGGGNETTILSILQGLLVHGMIIPGVVKGDHYGPVAINSPDERATRQSLNYGKLIAKLAAKLK